MRGYVINRRRGQHEPHARDHIRCHVSSYPPLPTIITTPKHWCRYTVYLLQQMLGRLRNLRGHCTILVNRTKLEVLARGSDVRIAEVSRLLLDANFPQALYNLLDAEAPAMVSTELMDYECVRMMALKVGPVCQLFGSPSPSAPPLTPPITFTITTTEHTAQVLKVFGPHGRAIQDSWCCCCDGYNTCAADKPCRRLNGRCRLCGSATHNVANCPNKFKPFQHATNLSVADGFCFGCWLPCKFDIANVQLHDSGKLSNAFHLFLTITPILYCRLHRSQLLTRDASC